LQTARELLALSYSIPPVHSHVDGCRVLISVGLATPGLDNLELQPLTLTLVPKSDMLIVSCVLKQVLRKILNSSTKRCTMNSEQANKVAWRQDMQRLKR